MISLNQWFDISKIISKGKTACTDQRILWQKKEEKKKKKNILTHENSLKIKSNNLIL